MMAQMTLMKQIQKKEEENRKLELALQKLNERRKLINDALTRQKIVADEKRKKAFSDIEKQKKRLEDSRKKTESHKMTIEEEIFQKADMLEAHKLLVDKSNRRILERIEEIKVSRQREALAEQERLVKEQQLAINLIKKMQSRRKQIQKQELRKKPRKTCKSEKVTINQTSLEMKSRRDEVNITWLPLPGNIGNSASGSCR